MAEVSAEVICKEFYMTHYMTLFLCNDVKSGTHSLLILPESQYGGNRRVEEDGGSGNFEYSSLSDEK